MQSPANIMQAITMTLFLYTEVLLALWFIGKKKHNNSTQTKKIITIP